MESSLYPNRLVVRGIKWSSTKYEEDVISQY